jgi:hypothetical protein
MGPIILGNVGVVVGLFIAHAAPDVFIVYGVSDVFVEIIGVAILIGALVCAYRWWESREEVRDLNRQLRESKQREQRLREAWTSHSHERLLEMQQRARQDRAGRYPSRVVSGG